MNNEYEYNGKNYILLANNSDLSTACARCAFGEDEDTCGLAVDDCTSIAAGYMVLDEQVEEPLLGALSKQEGGSHYCNLKIQPVEYIVANKLSFLEGNVVKYITRHKTKNGIEDVKKVIHYCELILQLEYNQTEKD